MSNNNTMITVKLKTDKESYENTVFRAAEILKNGGIVAIPTETVYGLAASACDETAIKKVFEAKGRPQDNPLIVHICNIGMLGRVAQNIPEAALKCAERFWPGPLTMVLKRTGYTAECVSAGLDTVAVRMPDHKTALDIIKQCDLPLAAPSANTSGSPSPTMPEHVEADLNGKIDAIVFDSQCRVGVESTVISFCCNPPRILRPGAVTLKELRETVPDITVDKAVLSEPAENEKVSSPGMKYKHYAPKTDSYLVEGNSQEFVNFVNCQENCVAVCFSEESGGINVPKLIYGSQKDESTLAHEVFKTLRKVDELGASKIYIHAPSKEGVGLAVYNRLIRAAAFRVIKL